MEKQFVHMTTQDLEELERLLSRFESYVAEQAKNDNSSFVDSDYRKVCSATDLVNDALMDIDNAENGPGE